MSKFKATFGFKRKLSKGGYLHLMIATIGIGRNGFALYLLNFWVSVFWEKSSARRFYVKFSHPVAPCEYLIIACSNDVFCSIVKREAYKFSDSEYDSIKHLLPSDHTLELV